MLIYKNIIKIFPPEYIYPAPFLRELLILNSKKPTKSPYRLPTSINKIARMKLMNIEKDTPDLVPK